MKKYVIALVFLINSSLIFSSGRESDSVKLIIQPDKISSINNDSIVYLTINNRSTDTLLTMCQLFLEGLEEGMIVYPMSGKFIPNIFILTSVNVPRMHGDGYYYADYYKFPLLLILPPYKQRVLKVSVDNYNVISSEVTWDISCYLSLAKKKNLENIISNYYNSREPEYLYSLVYSDTVRVVSMLSDSLSSFSKEYELHENESLNLIKDVFNIVIYNTK